MGYFPTDVAAQLAPRVSIAPQDFTQDTEVVGSGVERLGYNSTAANLALSFTTATGAAGDTVEVVVEVEHSQDDGDADAYEVFASVTQEIAVGDNDGDWSAVVVLPVNLTGADRYVRMSATVGHTGDGTLSAVVGSGVLALGGLVEKPDAQHSDAGYAVVNAPAA